MKYLGAYMLAVMGGNSSPSGDDIEKILGSCGIETDSGILEKVMEALDGKNVNELIAEGMTKLSSVPSGGGGGGGGGAAAAAGGGDSAAPAEAPKEEEKEESEEEEGDMGFDLFD